MAIGNRGVVFTLSAMVLVGFVFISMSVLNPGSTVSELDTLSGATRVTLMNSYIETFEQHAENSLRRAGYVAFQNLSRETSLSGDFYANLNSTLSDCIISNDLNGDECMEDTHTLDSRLGLLRDLAITNLNVHTSWDVKRVWVTDRAPMEVTLWMNMSYNVTDPLASWAIPTKTISVDLDLAGVDDPLYSYLWWDAKTSERRVFSASELQRVQMSPQNFTAHYLDRSYMPLEGRAPSVIQRYEGDFNATSVCCGIQSVVDVSALLDVTPDYANYSLTDHHLVSHLVGGLPEFNCAEEEVRAFEEPGSTKTIVLQRFLFDSVYNLSSERLSPCSWS